MISYDPHDDSFCAKNLREDEWHEYQKDTDTLILAEEIKEIFDQGLIAKIPLVVVQQLTLRVAMRSATAAILVQDMSPHWACLALAMLTHGRFWNDEEEKAVRFSKSPYDREPMYYNNIEYVPTPGRSWLMPVRKKPKDEVKTTGTTGNWENDTLDGIFGKGIKRRDSPQQNLFPDLYARG